MIKEYIFDFTMVFLSGTIVFDKESPIIYKIPTLYSLVLHSERIFRKLIKSNK